MTDSVDTPMRPRFFKYASPDRIDILTNLQIKVSDADKLNDPFELMPRVDPQQMTVENLMITLWQNHWIDDAYAEEGERLGIKSRKVFEEYYGSTLRRRAEKLESALRANDWQVFWANSEKLIKTSAQMFSEEFKLICGTSSEDSILMWSHYAEEHSGIVVEFDLTKPPFADLAATEIMEVDYKDERSELAIPLAGKKLLEEMHRHARRKASVWGYEQEIRIVMPSSMCSADHFLKITSESIKGLILGCRADPSLVSEAKMQARRPELSHIYLKQAVPHRDKFQLVFQRLDDADGSKT